MSLKYEFLDNSLKDIKIIFFANESLLETFTQITLKKEKR